MGLAMGVSERGRRPPINGQRGSRGKAAMGYWGCRRALQWVRRQAAGNGGVGRARGRRGEKEDVGALQVQQGRGAGFFSRQPWGPRLLRGLGCVSVAGCSPGMPGTLVPRPALKKKREAAQESSLNGLRGEKPATGTRSSCQLPCTLLGISGPSACPRGVCERCRVTIPCWGPSGADRGRGEMGHRGGRECGGVLVDVLWLSTKHLATT